MIRNRQKGVTAIGWLFLLTPFAIVIYGGIRLTPIYLNYMKVAKAMDQAGNELKASGVDAAGIRRTIDKHFEIDMVEYPTIKDITVTRDGADWVVESKYDDDAPLFGNVSLHVVFDKTVRIGASRME
jgi:Flp pilus assembly protein TadG